MTRRLSLVFALVLIVGPVVAVEPRCVLLIRHAEKPEREDMAVHLTPLGKKRAELLPELFVKSATRPDPFPRPDFLFAAKNSKSSHRSVETATPLAEKLKMPLFAEIKNDDFGILAKEILNQPKFSGKTILIAWHHGKLPELARSLGAADAPAAWPGKSFDRVWVITYSPTGTATFRDRPQSLLPDDTK